MEERKKQVLNAIIKDYIANAEPVGSRAVAKKYDRLDSYSQAVVEAVVDLELARVNTLGGQTAIEISSDLPETERDHQDAEAAI